MQHYKTMIMPAKEQTTKQVIEKITCDLCKCEIITESFDAEEVTILHKTGANYPEGGSGEETILDICGSCFDSKLIPWFKAQGAKPRVKEWDW